MIKVLLLLILSILASAVTTKSQGAANLPGPAIREGNRAMDDYDRAISRMKNDAKAARERRQNLFPQINEDFQRIQVIHNEIVRMLQPEKALDYGRLADLTEDMKKRGTRLRTNLALPEPDKSRSEPSQPETVDDAHMKEIIAQLHERVVSFVASPIFKNLGVVDAKVVDSATKDLDSIIDVSSEIKREAKLLSKSARK